jgi:hypothetical protein
MAGEHSHEFSARCSAARAAYQLGFRAVRRDAGSCALHPLRLLERSERLLQLRADTILN